MGELSLELEVGKWSCLSSNTVRKMTVKKLCCGYIIRIQNYRDITH